MSPEQWSGRQITPLADIYSLGCTFYHLIVGATPYPIKDLAGCFHAHLFAPVPDPKHAMPNIDPLLADLLRRCMAKRPEERPSAATIVEHLDDMLVLRRSVVRARPSAHSSPSFSEAITRPVDPPPSPLETTPVPRALLESSGGISQTTATPIPNLARTFDTASQAPAVAYQTGTQLRQSGTFDQQSYHHILGLKGYPFSDIRQPDHFWDAGPYAWAVRGLAQQVTLGQWPALLVGGPGSGRTFVCEMIHQIFPNIHIFTVEPQLLFGTRLFISLCRQLGVTINTTSSQRFLISAFLAQALPEDRPDAVAAIVIDGLDPNDDDFLDELGSIARVAPKNRLGMIFVGGETLPTELAAKGVLYDPASSAQPMVLRNMNQQEMLDYIQFRMTSIGGGRGLELDAGSKQLLFARSGGNPKLVNVYVHNALTITALKGDTQVRVEALRLGMKSKSYLTPQTALSLLKG